MRCPECRDPMQASADRLTHTCGSCGRSVTLRDNGYVPPRGGYVPPKPDAVDWAKPLPEEQGWSQDEPVDFAVIPGPTPRELASMERWAAEAQTAAGHTFPDRACRGCGQSYAPKSGNQRFCYPCGRGHALRAAETREIDRQTRQRALRGDSYRARAPRRAA